MTFTKFFNYFFRRIGICPAEGTRPGAEWEESIYISGRILKQARESARLTQKGAAKAFNIPLHTIQNWEQGVREAPEYTKALYLYALYTDYDVIPNIDIYA